MRWPKKGRCRRCLLGSGQRRPLIAVLSERGIEFFVVNTETCPALVKTGSPKFKENANFPIGERVFPQRALGSVVADRTLPFRLLKLDFQGLEIDASGLGIPAVESRCYPDGDVTGRLQ